MPYFVYFTKYMHGYIYNLLQTEEVPVKCKLYLCLPVIPDAGPQIVSHLVSKGHSFTRDHVLHPRVSTSLSTT